MSAPNINLKNLEFDQIKNELVTYLKSQSEFTDYNFEGSALSTIIDLLTYNTFYQIFFQNILINEMFLDTAQKLESIISHAKVQGYVVPGKTSSTAKLEFTNNGDTGTPTIPKYKKFRGIKNNSEVKLFYNIEDVSVVEGETVEFTVYEAKRFVNKAPITLDVTNQSVFIPEIDVDFRTLQVFVDEDEYKVVTSVEPNVLNEAKLCYLERRSNGYDVRFSGIVSSDGTEYDSSTLDGESITVTYAVPSGSLGNEVSAFNFVSDAPTGTLNTISPSSRGANAPSLESLKFAIPRTFSSQSRIVTEDDVNLFLLNNNYATNAVTIKVSETETGVVEVVGIEEEEEQAIEELNARSIVGIRFVVGAADGS
ncbi:MAG TPA: hypothetical protein DCX27_10270 [Balneola sp.]|nr:hypothetical protein [Balneola sp.]|tara:strand:+ start:1638 stop:2738 length:1101 start_codon:yes stop_codon:yes gene_type:complete